MDQNFTERADMSSVWVKEDYLQVSLNTTIKIEQSTRIIRPESIPGKH